MDDIARQFKGVSDGLMRIVARSPSSTSEPPSAFTNKNVSWNADDVNRLSMKQNISDSQNSLSDNEEGEKEINHGQQEPENYSQVNGGHLDNDLKEDPIGVPPEVKCAASSAVSIYYHSYLFISPLCFPSCFLIFY